MKAAEEAMAAEEATAIEEAKAAEEAKAIWEAKAAKPPPPSLTLTVTLTLTPNHIRANPPHRGASAPILHRMGLMRARM